jgi:hypothetical protein
MTNSRFKIPMIALVLVVIAVGASTYLFGRQHASLPAATMVHSPLTSPAAMVTASTQPKITWSTTSIEVILSPGESKALDVSLTSSLGLKNIAIGTVPQIAGLLSIQPGTVTSLAAGQNQPVHLAFTIPTGTTFGTYTGTIHVLDATQTYPQTVKVVVGVWQTFDNPSLGFDIKYPPGWNAYAMDESHIGFIPPGKQVDLASEYVGDIVVESFSNPSDFDISTYYHQIGPVDLFANSQSNAPLSLNGLSAVKFIGVFGMIPSDTVAVSKNSQIVEISDVGQLHQIDGLPELMASSIR